MSQYSFYGLSFEIFFVETRKELFLEEMEVCIPCKGLAAAIGI